MARNDLFNNIFYNIFDTRLNGGTDFWNFLSQWFIRSENDAEVAGCVPECGRSIGCKGRYEWLQKLLVSVM